MMSPNCPQCLRSCCSTMSLDSTGTLIILIGTKRDAVPAGGRGWVVKCWVAKGVLMKSCCASPVGKQTSKRETSVLDTTPETESGILSMISPSQSSTYPEGSGRKAECREEGKGKRRGTENCSKFTEHSVWSPAGFFFRATSAHERPVAMVST